MIEAMRQWGRVTGVAWKEGFMAEKPVPAPEPDEPEPEPESPKSDPYTEDADPEGVEG